VIRLDPVDAAIREAPAGVAEQPCRAQHVEDDHRLEHVELEMPVAAGDRDGDVIAHDFRRDHGQGLALGRVDLARHDR